MLLYNPKTGKGINVPDIDAPGWMTIRGYTTTPPTGVEAVQQPPLFSPTVTPLPRPEAVVTPIDSDSAKQSRRWTSQVIDVEGEKAVAGYLDGDIITISKVHDTALISPESAVLAFINAAEKTYQLTAIPTVGHAAAKAIIENRPEDGYQSLDDLAPILPQRSSLSAIKAWMPSHG